MAKCGCAGERKRCKRIISGLEMMETVSFPRENTSSADTLMLVLVMLGLLAYKEIVQIMQIQMGMEMRE